MLSFSCRACLTRVLSINSQVRAIGSRSKAGDETPLKRLLDNASSFGEADPAEPELQWATQPYATRPQRRPVAERTEPQETTVVLFPGQGSQHVGMGKRLLEIPAARELYRLASDVVGWNVEKLCTDGPEHELERHCQTTVLVTSLAALELVRETRPSAIERVRATAGFSLGEITALVFAGALQFEQALRVVEIRAAAMNAAASTRPGGMLTVWLTADANLPHAMLRARDHATEKGVEGPICQVANYLFPNCKVVAGDEEALKYLEKRGKEYGIKRAARVRVSGAFHTPAMLAATDVMRQALKAIDIQNPKTKVISAVDAKPYRDASHVRKQLAKQIVAPVRWEQTLHALYARPIGEPFPLTLALGPSLTMRSTLKQVNAKAWDSSLQIDV